MLVIFVWVLSLILGGYSLEPKCSKFAYDEQLLEKMIRMEVNAEKKEEMYKAERDEMMKTIAALNKQIEALQADKDELRGTVQSGFEGINQKVSNQLQTLELWQHGLNQSKGKSGLVVAFSANTVKNKNPSKGEIIVFTTVTINEGRAYNKTTGKFTAPVDGVYIFHDQLCVKSKMDFYHAFVVNDKEMTRERYVNPDSEAPLCFTSVFTNVLRTGQEVYMKCRNINKRGLRLEDDSNRLNMFYGALMREN